MPSGIRGYLNRGDREVLAEGDGVGLPAAPPDLAGTALDVYELLRDQCGWLGGADAPLAVQCARLEGECAEYRRTLAADGYFQDVPVMTAKGDLVAWKKIAHPAIAELRRAETSLARVQAALVLPPQLRARLGVKAESATEAATEAAERTTSSNAKVRALTSKLESKGSA